MTAPDPRLKDLEGCALELAREAGFDAGERLIVQFGGQRLFVPRKMRPSSPMWDALGPITAKKLAELFGGNYIDVPTGAGITQAKRTRQIRAFLAGQNLQASKNKVAKLFKVNRRTVQRHRAALKHPEDSPQGALAFDRPSKRP